MTDPTSPVTPYWTPPPPPSGYGYPVGRPTNGMSIAAMVLAILALPASCFSYGVGGLVMGLLGAIFGHVARRQIRQRDEQGGGMALTGVILGWISFGISLLYLIAMILFFVYGIDYLNQLEQQQYDMLVGWLH